MERRIHRRPPEPPRPRVELEIDLPRRHRSEEDEEEAPEKKPPRGVAVVDFYV